MATGYNANGSAAILYDLGYVSPAGQMFSSTRDLDNVSQCRSLIYTNGIKLM